MVSTFGSLNTVITGLQAQQLSLNTVGHNMANATTEGFSRQRVNLITANSQRIYTGRGAVQLGLGVTTQSITRIRDVFIDRQYWKENSILGTNATTKTYLTKIEDVFGEPLETGMETLMNNFWESIETLSTDASNHSTRAVVVQNGVSLCNTIQQETKQLMNMVSDINLMVKLRVDSVNQLTEEILVLNKKISSIEAGKLDNANDLRDRRDYLIDQLSYMIDIQVNEDASGSYVVYSGGINLVTSDMRRELTTEPRMDSDYGYEVLDIIDPKTNNVVTFNNGEIAAMVNTRDSDTAGIKKYLNDLSNMAKFLLQEFNDVHKAGIDLDGNAGVNFFGVPGTDYNSDPVADPTGPAATFKKGDWIKHLMVSTDLTNPTTGTAKVAARTILGEATQNNPQTGHAIIGYDTTQTPGDVINDFHSVTATEAATLASNLVPPLGSGDYEFTVKVQVTMDACDSDGNVTAMSYAYIYDITDITQDPPVVHSNITGTNGPCIPTQSDTGSTIFSFEDFTIQVARAPNNIYNPANPATYTFSVPTQMQGRGAGDNAVNLCNRLKTDISATIGDSSLDAYYSAQMGTLGVQSQSAEHIADNQQAVVDQLLTARESVCGVNQDEELTEMIRFQKAYNSAARILTAMDEMLEKLINGTGRVGA